jgi:hypothetical protein
MRDRWLHRRLAQLAVITSRSAGPIRDCCRAVQYRLLALSLVTACASEPDPASPLTPDAQLPRVSGTYASGYRVPVSDPALEAAAVFTVDHAEWTVVGDSVTLHYDLPIGLVGGKLDVTFTGTLTPEATTLELRSAQGTGTCVATASTLTCHELFANLGALPISIAVVEQTASLEYAGPVADRTRVASDFASEPIGFVDLALDQPVIDDNGGDGGGSDD